jgi:hypothetical protein
VTHLNVTEELFFVQKTSPSIRQSIAGSAVSSITMRRTVCGVGAGVSIRNSEYLRFLPMMAPSVTVVA